MDWMFPVLRGDTIFLHSGKVPLAYPHLLGFSELEIWFCLIFECVMALVESQNFSTYNSQQKIMQRCDNLGLIEDDMTRVGAREARLF